MDLDTFLEAEKIMCGERKGGRREEGREERGREKGERKGDLIWTRTVLPKLSSLGGGGALFSS